MATKKNKPMSQSKPKKKSPASAKAHIVKKQTISVHPRLARAIRSMKRLAPSEMQEVVALAEKAKADGVESTGCWLTNSGGEQHCIDLPPDVCTRRGGISVPTPCPNN